MAEEYTRIKGGEKNAKSGKRWSESELRKILDLYFDINGIGIHEHNPKIHRMSKILQRTVRSVEAQLLMFRNLDKHGDYTFGNMNKLCKDLWKEHLESIKK
ncbi:MAG: hypothetical protein U0X39_08325 [Bacteroidales bacterium]